MERSGLKGLPMLRLGAALRSAPVGCGYLSQIVHPMASTIRPLQGCNWGGPAQGVPSIGMTPQQRGAMTSTVAGLYIDREDGMKRFFMAYLAFALGAS